MPAATGGRPHDELQQRLPQHALPPPPPPLPSPRPAPPSPPSLLPPPPPLPLPTAPQRQQQAQVLAQSDSELDTGGEGDLATDTLTAWSADPSGAPQLNAADYLKRVQQLPVKEASAAEMMAALGRQLPAPRTASTAAAVRKLQQARTRMRGPEGAAPRDAAEFDRAVRSCGRPEGSLRAGQANDNWPAWEELLAQDISAGDQEAAEALNTVKHGMCLDFVDVSDPQKQAEPNHRRKLAGVQRDLRRAGYSADEVAARLQGSRPTEVCLPNRFASEQDEQAFHEAHVEMLRIGAVAKWPFEGTRPRLILPCSGVWQRGKFRAIYDARYLNLFLRYIRFHYEMLMDLIALLRRGDSVVSTKDLKKGYQQFLMEAAAWPLLGFVHRGDIHVYLAFPFGLAPSPRAFTKLLAMIYRLPRSVGWPLVAMIDDSAHPAAETQQGRWRMLCIVPVEAALGLLHSWEKCELEPGTLRRFLGLLVDTDRGLLLVPQDKVQRFQATAAAALAGDAAARRSALGMLASFVPALRMARGMGRWLREWDGEAPPSAEWAAELLTFFREELPRLNGRPWDLHSTPAVQLCTDASDRQYGALVLGDPFRASVPFQPVESLLSSTVRELRGAQWGLRGLLQQRPQLVRGGVVQVACRPGALLEQQQVRLWLDSQTAVGACAREGTSRAAVWQEVKALLLLAHQHGLALQVVWHPRTAAVAREADALSKRDDPHDWQLSRRLLRQHLLKAGFGVPDLDCFASALASQCSKYFAAVFDGSCAGVDGLAQSWAPDSAGRPLCFVAPPLYLLREALVKIRREKAEAIVVAPRQLAPQLQAVLDTMRASVKHCDLQGPPHVLMRPTVAVPAKVAEGGWKTCLQLIRISW